MFLDVDVYKVGLIFVILMVLGNIMGLGVFLLFVNLVFIGGIVIYGWLVMIIGVLGFLMVYVKMLFFDLSSGGFYVYVCCCFGLFFGY